MMDFSLFKRSGLKLLPVLLTLTASPGLLHATNVLTASPATASFTCSTNTGTTPVTFTLTPGSASTSAVVVSFATPLTNGLVVMPNTATIPANTKNPVTFTATLAPGCVGVSAGTPVLQFKYNGAIDAAPTITVNANAAGTVNPLAANPSPVTVSCVYNPASGGRWTPGPPVTVSVTSAATGGTPVVPTTSNAWLSLGTVAGSPATTTAATFTVQAVSPCNSATSGTVAGTIALGAGGVATSRNITANVMIVPQSPLTVAPSSPSLTYVKNSGSAGTANVAVTATVPTNNYFFSINPATLPNWLTADSLTGSTPRTIRFSTTNVADSLAPGTYSGSVHIDVSNYGDFVMPVTMLLTNPAAKLTVAEGITRPLTWMIGQPLPTPVITAVSSDTPLAYSVTTAGTLGPIVPSSELSGLAYSFGTPINVSFNPLVFASAVPNQVLTGTVTLTYGSPAQNIVVTFNITVQSPSASLTSLSPATIPTANATPLQTYTITLTGSGFITGNDNSKRTAVGIVVQGASNNALTIDTNFAWTVQNSSTIFLTITVPSTTDNNLPFAVSGNGGPVTIGVCNPINGTACTTASGSQGLNIGANPIIQAVTSSSALLQNGGTPSIAPYDMISVFGSNFCAQGGSGCGSNTILYGTPDPVLQNYPTFLTPDTGASPRNLTITFFAHGTTTPVLATAPLLFATNSQINLLVPSALASKIGSSVDMYVNFGARSSAVYVIGMVATDPGLFTIGADGQGPAAALDQNFNLITATNPAAMRHSVSSDYVSFYLTGLGVPATGADDTAVGTVGGAVWTGAADCASTTSYLTELTNVTGNVLPTMDGLIINPAAVNTHRLAPCIIDSGGDAVSVTIGGVAVASIAYAGWVDGTVAGLYQVTAYLPASDVGSLVDVNNLAVTEAALAKSVALPVVISSNSVHSQGNVVLSVQRRLAMASPSTTSGNVGEPWTSSTTSASAGTGPYTYTITSGLLPPGLHMDPTTSAITGTPNAGTSTSYTLTVTATDSTVPTPLQGSITFTLVISGGVYMTHTGPTTATNGAADTLVTTETPTSGTGPYTYAISAADTTSIAGLNISSGGVVSTLSSINAGTYNVAATATDSSSPTQLMGEDLWTLIVKLGVTKTALASLSAGVGGTLTALTTTGLTGSVSYTLDPTTAALGWLSIDGSGNVIASSSCVTGTHSVTITATDSSEPANATAVGTGTITFSFTI